MLTSLITNLQRISKEGKESNFGKRWSATTAFQKQFEREGFVFDEVEQTAPTRQLSDQILNAYQNQPKEENRQFVNRVRDQSLSFLAERRGLRVQQMQRIARLNESMTVIVRSIFDTLESFSMELNCYVGCTELQTAGTRPQHVREIIKFSKTRHPLESVTFFRARMASPSWSLVIRGGEGRIDMFLLPVGKVMGLSKSEATYTPVAVIEGKIENDETTWTTGGTPLTAMKEQEICMELFSQLIENTKKQLELDFEHSGYGDYRA